MRYAISANRLLDGIVVFVGPGPHWVYHLSTAALFPNKGEAEAALETARLDEKKNIVIDPYIFDVRGDAGAPAADHIREAIRAAGPSVRRDHGKQADKHAEFKPVQR